MTTNGRSINTKLHDLIWGIRDSAWDPNVTSDGIREVLYLLEPTLYKIIKAHYLARERWNSQDLDDLTQSARIGIWQAIESVDLERPASIRGFLIRSGINKVISHIRAELRRRRVEVVGLPSEEELIIRPEQIISLDLGDNDLLALYLDFIKLTGQFKGAHEYVAQIKGIKKYKLKTLLNKRAAELSENMDIARRLGMRRKPDGTSIFDDNSEEVDND